VRRELEARLAARSHTTVDEPSLEDSAVVLPLRAGEEPCVAFIRRSGYRDEHAGEIGLPGGRADADDAALRETAVRELEEEVGVAADDVALIGRLDDQTTQTGYRIAPFVGYVDAGVAFDPCEEEVDELVLVPLSVLQRQYEPGASRFEHDDAVIWGATGRIVGDFLSALSR